MWVKQKGIELMQKTVIPTNEVEFKGGADRFGKVFVWQDRIFRALSFISKDFCL